MKLIALATALLLSLCVVRAAAAGVGFSEIRVPDGAARPLVVGVWYPSDAPAAGPALPLIVMSHGNGGWYGGHRDTAMALAEHGFVVAAVSHTGDTYDDQSRATHMMDRPEHIHRLIDFMLGAWRGPVAVDPGRVGMFGFSSGGFTALVSIGGVPDLDLVPAHNVAHPDYFDAQLTKRSGVPLETFAHLPPSIWVHDARIKAAVVAAPALGYAFGRAALKDVHIPVQLWRAERDHILPNPDYAEAVRLALPKAPEYHVVAGGDHFDFLMPCDDQLKKVAPQICVSPPGFDRTAFHRTFNREVIRFFEAKL